MQEIVGLNSKWASTLMSQHLLAAADRYALDRLKLLCEAKLCEDVAINTVATTLALAEQHHCFQLKAVCLKVIALPENLRGIFSPEYFYILISLLRRFTFFFFPLKNFSSHLILGYVFHFISVFIRSLCTVIKRVHLRIAVH